MKNIALSLSLFLGFQLFAKDVYVQGYYRKSGTYVQPYYRTAPDNTPTNNYGSKGNYNPYTGKGGTKDTNNYNYPSNRYGSDDNSDD